jgi:hypothetical protein
MLAKTAQLFCRQVGPFLRCIGYWCFAIVHPSSHKRPNSWGLGQWDALEMKLSPDCTPPQARSSLREPQLLARPAPFTNFPRALQSDSRNIAIVLIEGI